MQNDFQIWKKKLLILPGGFLVIYTVSLFLYLVVLSPDSKIYEFVYYFIHVGISAPGMILIELYYGQYAEYSYPLTYLALPINLLILSIVSFLGFSDNKIIKKIGLIVLALLITTISFVAFFGWFFFSRSWWIS